MTGMLGFVATGLAAYICSLSSLITANQAMLWQGLRVAGVPSRMDQYGRLYKVEPTSASD